MIRVIVLLLLISVGCQSGKIPCPKVKAPKLVKSTAAKRYKIQAVTAKLEVPEPASDSKSSAKTQHSKYIKHVDVEEWDCPEPGTRKYMPKNVRENIRRNAKRISEEGNVMVADSLSHN